MKRLPQLFPVPTGLVAFGAIIYGIAWLHILVVMRVLGGATTFFADDPLVAHFSQLPMVFLGLAAAIFGFWHVARHPALSSTYRAWLVGTPWKYPMRLPLAPVLPVWQDVTLCFLLAAAGWFHPMRDPLLPLAIYAGAYVVATLPPLLAMKMWPQAAVTLALSLAGLALWPDRTLILLVLPIATGWALWTMHQSLARLSAENLALSTKPRPVSAGFPFDQLSPRRRVGVPLTVALGSAVAFGWYTFCIVTFALHLGVDDPQGSIFMLGSMAGLVLALGRFLIYVGQYGSPINLRGRIATGRLIIWGYDQILIAPMALVFAGFAISMLVFFIPVPLAAGACMAGLIFIALAAGPNLHHWRLTAPVRINGARPTPPKQSNAGLKIGA